MPDPNASSTPSEAATSPRTATTVAVLALAAAALFVGWSLFWFVCDDAYITFRYASNRQLGWGYVWNPPPFAPVEGYTSFSWLVLVDAVWAWFGVEPPVAAPALGLLCAWGTLLVIAGWLWRLRLPAELDADRPWLLAWVFVGVLSNTTFLAWTSSGLEAPLVVLLLTAWASLGMVAPRGTWWPLAMMSVASMITLTRPDGLLFLAATPVVIAADRLLRGWGKQDVWAVGPVLVVWSHLLWRKSTYDAWLPNTYLAKVLDPWPEMGIRYFKLFVVQYGYFLWVPLALCALWVARRALISPRAWARNLPGLVALGALLAHTAYYVLRVGGDHFEFRVLAHWPALLMIAAVWMLSWVARRGAWVGAGMALLTLAGGVIAWPDWIQNREIEDSRAQRMSRPVAPKLPTWLGPWTELHDQLEKAATRQAVAISHQTHRTFAIRHGRNYPAREDALAALDASVWDPGRIDADAYPVHKASSVGLPAWRMPTVAVIDILGLNDEVVARTEPSSERLRVMAHTRRPPAGYVDCFQPNVKATSTLKVRPRREPLSWDGIARCQADFLLRARRGELKAGK